MSDLHLRILHLVAHRSQRDEFAVVSDGSGGPVQEARARRVAQSLSDSGARWVTTAVEPAMT